jgi:hypothetical protein
MARPSLEQIQRRAIDKIGKRVLRKFAKPRKLIRKKEVVSWQLKQQYGITEVEQRKYD